MDDHDDDIGAGGDGDGGGDGNGGGDGGGGAGADLQRRVGEQAATLLAAVAREAEVARGRDGVAPPEDPRSPEFARFVAERCPHVEALYEIFTLLADVDEVLDAALDAALGAARF